MDQIFNNFLQTASVYQKGFFLMAAGVSCVFAVQLLFYMIVKLWPKPKT